MGGQLEIRDVFPEGDVRITRFQTLAVPNTERDSRPFLMADNILPFPLPYRGAPNPRWMALAAIGFQ
jgi:hypothetical protein